MKDRCYRENDKRYKDYGERGITICQEWLNDFQAFYDWAMANGYREDLTIDRIDVNGNYEPSNCRWVAWEEQARNKRSNRLITIENETLPLVLWLKRVNMKKTTFYHRVKRGWSEEKAILTPVAVVK